MIRDLLGGGKRTYGQLFDSPEGIVTNILDDDQRGSHMNGRITHYANKLSFETDSWDLKAVLESGDPVVVIDARAPEAFQKEHILGAINIPHRAMSPETTRRIDKSVLVVTYCDGIGCNASTRAALNMATLGFRVKELIGGLDWWKRDGHKTEGVGISSDAAHCGCD